MKSTQDFSEYLDLSYLSTNEELAIRQVLQRDENLKQRENGRIRRLHHSTPDRKMLKVMTGEWFQELRNRRYGRQSDVTDVVRSSMKKRKTKALRSDPSCNVGQTDNEGGGYENRSQAKTPEIDPGTDIKSRGERYLYNNKYRKDVYWWWDSDQGRKVPKQA
ncbi:hypothetical protein DPEC_G00310280 [Dallia pectoralis]|uniref:Uncharacterized protein n=1 Tax=Dallia pectoralis TaxID=75939 RepID=A0ACC2FF91_DALPE|nr:hypothetical protein DPEC_G00310280 [Dallia pectoralis]